MICKKTKSMVRTRLASDWKLKTSNVIFEIQQNYSLIKISQTLNYLQSFGEQILVRLLINISIRCFIFKSSLADCLRNYVLNVVSNIFAKAHSTIRAMFRSFECKIIKKLRTSSLSKNYLVLIKRKSFPCTSIRVFLQNSCPHNTTSFNSYISVQVYYTLFLERL